MKDFKESLKAGIEAAQEAERNKKEIALILENINDQVKDISDNKATFGKVTFKRVVERERSHPANIFIDSFIPPKMEEYEGLAILDGNKKNAIMLTEWEQNSAGYPCYIRYNGQKLICKDKMDLENSLSSLLEEVKTGEAILEQIRKASIPSDKSISK